jgi:predicted dehydrogenase
MIEISDAIPASTGTLDPRESSKRPRLGFLGLGWIGRKRLESLATRGVAEIFGIADCSEAAVSKAQEVAPGAVTARDLSALLELDLDGIVIATPSALHAEQASAALQNGCAVFCQKPLARTAGETHRVVEAAREADRLLGVDLSYRHTAGMRAIRELIRSGGLGSVYAIEATFHNAYGPDKSWFYDAALSGGGCLLDLGTHLVDLILWCLDSPEVERVSARLLARGKVLGNHRSSVEDFAAAQLHFANASVAQLACSWKVPAGCDAHIELSFYGTEGGARFRNMDGSFYRFTAAHLLPDRITKELAGPSDDWEGGAIIDWARRLAVSPKFDPDIAGVTRVATILDSLYDQCT